MEKITRKPLSEIPSLKILHDNWEDWGKEFKKKLQQSSKTRFSWKSGIYEELRTQLSAQTQEHCSFCDSFLLSDTSKETIEHYQPKKEFPELAYQWENLYFCCDKCQSAANSIPFSPSLRPDSQGYHFDNYFYFDTLTGNVEVLENKQGKEKENALRFLERYGINEGNRPLSRRNTYRNIRNLIGKETEDGRIRNDFAHRFVFDCVYADQNAQSSLNQ